MTWLTALFWLSATCVLYTYVAYPVVLATAVRLRSRRRTTRDSSPILPVSVLVAAYNEETVIGSRVRELARLVAGRSAGGEVIVVSDGSTDRTVEVARAAATEAEFETGAMVPIRVLALPTNLGKAAALNAGWAAASHPFLVFADVRQTWAPDAIERITENFADPTVGAVSGDLVVEAPAGVMAGFGLYWRFEKWLRRTESRFDSLVSVTGSICAVRREHFRPIPNGTILDDAYWPLVVAMGGHRVVHDDRAHAFDRLPGRVRDEFRRKVRTLSGNFQLLTRLPSALLPWRNPVWWQFVSHRPLRLLVPWALIGLAASAAALDGPSYRVALWLQAAFYLLAVAGTSKAIATRSSVASVAASLLILNTAAWIAFWVWISGRANRSWGKFAYGIAPPTHEIHEAAPVGVER